MTERLKQMLPDHTMSLAPTLAGITISFTAIETVLRVTVLVLTIAYNLWLWRRKLRQDRNRDDHEP